jgi:hypothetical protein
MSGFSRRGYQGLRTSRSILLVVPVIRGYLSLESRTGINFLTNVSRPDVSIGLQPSGLVEIHGPACSRRVYAGACDGSAGSSPT